MNLSDINYNLPEELIAQHHALPRDSSKLMVLENNLEHIDDKFYNIYKYLKKGDVLVLNDTRVMHAKLIGKKDSGSQAEIVLLQHIKDNEDKTSDYEAKIKTRNPHIGTNILIYAKHPKKSVSTNESCTESAIILSQKTIDTYIIRLSNKSVLKHAILPTPPYIKRILSDKEYQTEFSKQIPKNRSINYKNIGSLAAPTAGLHFTKTLLKKIQRKGIKIVYITLHVSYGTFKNIDDVKTYKMDPEWYSISKKTASTINKRKGRLIVCGTTTLKALETASVNGKVKPESAESTLFIYPPYKFQSGTDALITNFHLPQSTLLLLTCAFGGTERILQAYAQAIKKRYKFFSLGDAMMIYNYPPVNIKPSRFTR